MKHNILFFGAGDLYKEIVEACLTEDRGFALEHSPSIDELLSALAKGTTDLVLIGGERGDASWYDAFLRANNSCPQVPLVIIADPEQEELALSATGQGAEDYLLSNNLRRLKLCLANVLKRKVLEESAAARLRSEDSLRRSEYRHNQAQAMANIGSWERNFATGVALWSEEALRIFGLPPQEKEQTYEAWVSRIHPDDLEHVLEANNKAKEDFSATSVFHRIIRADGAVRHLHSRAQYEFDERGVPVGLYGVSQDITEVREAQMALRESEMRFAELFQQSPNPSMIYDLENYRFVNANPAALKLYEYSEEEFLELTVFDIRPEAEVSKLKKLFNSDFSIDNKGLSGQFRHRSKSGRLIDVEVYGCPVFVNGRKLRSVIIVDITEKLRMENAVTRAILETQEEERYEIGIELHDNVCQILATSLLSLARLQPSLSAAAAKPFFDCRTQIKLALKEIRNLSHRLAPAFGDDATMEDALRYLLDAFNFNNRYDISLRYDARVDELRIPLTMRMNLYRIVQEQLANILKHADAQSIVIQVGVQDGRLSLVVADNGVGADSATVSSGIGIRNMKRRAELFSGKFDIDFSREHGCILSLSLPIPEVEGPADKPMFGHPRALNAPAGEQAGELGMTAKAC